MTTKVNVESLKKIIKEQVQTLLNEQQNAKKELKDSLDQQVDDLLISYESDAKIKEKNEAVDFNSMTRKFLTTLSEAEGDEKEKVEEPKKKLTSEDINIEKFTSDVVRLIDNYDSLLEVRNTLARRAINFLMDNYDPSVANEFKIVLEDQHDISIGKSSYAEKDEEYPAPPAERSGGTGA